MGEDKKDDEKDTPSTVEEGKPLDLPISKEQMELQKKAKEYLAAKNGNIDDVSETPIDPTISEVVEEAKKKGRKRKRTKEFDDDSSEESSEEEGEDDMPPGMDKKPIEEENKCNEGEENTGNKNASECENEPNEQLKEV